MRTIFSKQSIMYSPLKDITAYEVARVIEVNILCETRRDKFLWEFIEKHKIGRHFKKNGMRGK